MENVHVCNVENEYYLYCFKNNLPLISLPKGHCIWCGDVLITVLSDGCAK